MRTFLAEIWFRKVHWVALSALTLIAVDAWRVPVSRPDLLAPLVWFLLYTFAASTVAMFIAVGNLWTLQLMTAVVSFVGLLRGVTFFMFDGRLTPLGLNLLIAAYAYLVHAYERNRVW